MSTYTHLILEVFCGYGWDEDNCEPQPVYCERGIGSPGYHCFRHNCKFVTYTYAPNEIAYSDKDGEVPDFEACIGFGGDMEPLRVSDDKINALKALWEEVCRRKIKEAYEEYMRLAGIK